MFSNNWEPRNQEDMKIFNIVKFEKPITPPEGDMKLPPFMMNQQPQEIPVTPPPPELKPEPIVEIKRDSPPRNNIEELIDIETIELSFPCCILIAGKSNSGKTVLFKKFIELHNSKFDLKIMVSTTAHINKEYSDIEFDAIIHPDHLEPLEKLITVIEGVIKKGYDIKTLVVVDNFVGSLNVHNGSGGKIFDKLSSQGRHLGITTIFLTQRLTKVSPTVRDNTNFAFITRINRESIMGILFGLQDRFSDKYKFYEWYKKITTNVKYTSIFINNNNPYGKSVLAIRPITIENPGDGTSDNSSENDD